MRTLKLFVAIVMSAAVAAQPALAAIQPCCCVKQVEVEPPCCAAKHAKPEQITSGDSVAVPARSCCAKKTAAAALVRSTGCCCQMAPPAAAPSRDQAKQVSEQAPLVPVLAAVDLLDAAPAARGVAHVSEIRPLSGPPLLALYCIWRK